MAKSNLKVGLLSVVNAKLGLNDVKLYLGTTLLYPIRDSISSATVTCSSATYTGSAQIALNIVVKLGTKTLTSGTDYTVTLNNGGTNAGTYTVVVTGINDYEGTASGSFVINKANISPSVSIENWTYGGTAKNPSVSGNTGGGTVTYTYSSDGSTWSSTKPSNAGTYTIKASIAATTNYNSGTATNTFTISKAACPVAITGKSLTYNRASQTLVGITNPQSQTIHYKVGSGSWSTTAPTSTNCGSWTIYWYVDANSNYNGVYSSSSPANVSSSMAKVTPVLSTSPTKTADWTYDGQSHALASGGAMKHSSSDSTAVAGAFTYGSATNAGTHTATWSFTPTDTTNYNSTSGNVGTVTVSKATGTATVSGRTVSYSRSAQNLVSVSGNTGTMHYRVGTSGSWLTTIPTRTNAGSDTVYYYMDASTNYTARGSESSPWGNVTGTINKVTPVTSTAPTKRADWTYNGTQYNLASGGAMKHSSTDSTAVAGTFTYATGKDAGSYSATWTFTPTDTTNYNTATGNAGTVVVSKATGSTGCSGRTLTYNRSAQNLVSVSGNTGTNHYRVGTSGSWSTTIPTATNAGSYDVYVYTDTSTNYNAVSTSSSPSKYTTTIAQVTPVLSTAPTNTTPTFNNSDQNLLTGGAMKHSSSDSTAVAGTFTYGKGKNAGTYNTPSWSFTPTDTTNYKSTSGTISTSTTISKATMSVTEVNYNAAYDGSSHSSTVKVNSAGWDGKTIVYGSSTSYGNTATSSGVTGTAYAVKTATNYTASTTVYYKVTGGTNFDDYADSVTFQISKKSTAAPVLAAGGTTTYTGTTYYATAKNGNNNPAGTIYYGSSSGATTYSLTASSTAANMTSMGRANVGTTTIYAFFRPTDTTNYSDSAGATTTVTITNKATGYLTATKTNRTYNGSAQTIGTIATNSGDYYFGLGNSSTSAPSSWGSKNTALSATAAGDYYIWAKCDTSTNYNAVAAKYIDKATISKRTVTITAPTKTDRNYTGSAQTIFAAGSCTTGGTMYYSDTNKTFSTSTWSTTLPYTLKTDAGTYAMYYYCYVSDTANNTGTNINTILSVSATINKVAATLPGTISGDRVDKDHTPARATVSKDYTGGTLQYSTNNGSSWANVTWYSGNLTANPSTSTEGDTSVLFRVNPDDNHTMVTTSSAITLTVVKATDATVTITLATGTLTYSGSAQTIATASGAHGIANYYIGYKKGGTASADNQVTWGSANTTPLQATDAGDYYVYYKFTVDSSHSGDKAYTYVGKVTINKKSRSGAVSCNNVTYGSTVTASVSGNTETGTITWGITAGTGTATINGGVVTPTKVGKVTVTATVAATANYAAYTATSKEITISQRTVTWNAPTRTNRTYNGNDLTIFAVGSSTAGGTMKYSSDNSTWSTSLPYTLKKEPGTYTIYYKCEVSDTTNNTGTNINTSYSLSATISKISTNTPVLTASSTTTFDNTTHYATAKNGSGNPAGTIYYGASSGATTYNITASSTAANLTSMGRKDVGTTTIYAFFRPTDTTHYADSANATTTVTISNKAAGSSGSVSNPSSQTFKESGTYTFQLGISGATGTVTYPTSITVKDSSQSTVTGWTCTSAGVVTVPAGTNAGLYAVVGNVTVAASTNYNAVSATSKTWTVTINKADQAAPTTVNGATTNYPTNAVASASGGGGKGSIEWSNGSTQSGVGEKTTKARWSGNTNYNPSPYTAAVTVKVNQGTPTITEPTPKTGASQAVYNGTTQYTYNKGTNTTAGSFTYSPSGAGYRTDPGTDTINWTFTPTDSGYKTLSGSFEATLAKYTPTITLSATNRTYNGSPLYATATVSKPNYAQAMKGTIYYGTSSSSMLYQATYNDTSVALSNVSITNVGSTTVYAYFVPNSTCDAMYNGSGTSSKTMTISRATGSSGSVSNPASQVYTNSTSTHSFQLGISGATGTVTYPTSITAKNSSGTTLSGWSCTSAGVLTAPAKLEVGTYTVTGNITVAQSTNYNAVGATSKTWTVTIITNFKPSGSDALITSDSKYFCSND